MRKALGFALAFISGSCFGAVLAWETSKGTVAREVEKQTASIFAAAEKSTAYDFSESIAQAREEEQIAYTKVINEVNYQVDVAQPNSGIHHISEDEWDNEESFEKVYVEIFMTDDLPVFLFDGVENQDWFTHLGETIILTGDETKDSETFYVRNHILRADYEVTWGQP
jgi:hypothetical protein